MGKEEPLFIVGVQTGAAAMEINMVVPQRLEIEISNPTPIHRPMRLSALLWRCSLIHVAAAFTVIRKWNQPICLSADEQIMKMWCIYVIKFYLAIKRNENMKLIGTWIYIARDYIKWGKPSPRGQGHCMSSHMWVLHISKYLTWSTYRSQETRKSVKWGDVSREWG